MCKHMVCFQRETFFIIYINLRLKTSKSSIMAGTCSLGREKEQGLLIM